MPESAAHEPLLRWYADHARDLPWRRPDASPWAVLVSEVMLQQTPVARVLPVYDAWLDRWPTPSALADERPGEAVRMWGRLGYPRRALRLHQAAVLIDELHHGRVPRDWADLRGLPGVGDYTAAAVAAFAFGNRVVVLDTNVRRMLGRLLVGSAMPPPTVTVAERTLAEAILPDDPRTAASWSVAAMELGALVCTSRAPACPVCPLAALCLWRSSGYPKPAAPRRPTQGYAGTDRQCRGSILAVLRAAAGPVTLTEAEAAWADGPQRARAVASLLADGLVVPAGQDGLALP